MADNVEIQGIEFQIVNDSTTASASLDKLAQSLKNIKTCLGGASTSLNRAASSISQIKNALNKVNSGDFENKLKRISNGLEMLGSKTASLKISSSIGNQISSISAALDSLKWTDGDKLTALADGLRPLTELGKANLNSFLTQLGKLPGIINQLEEADIDKFSQQMKELAAAIAPFANEMNKVSNGFSAFPSRIQRLIRSTEQYNDTAKKSTKINRGWANSFNLIKGVSFIGIFRMVSNALSNAITKASEYQETLNLFTVSMGEYGEEAYTYAEKVSEIMGIDPAEWMKNQGVFNTIITGFGVAGDKAAYMSKNLTQLAYDLSSFYNIGFTEAMQKVQSGIAGELEPLRRLGYDLSVARLEQERLNLGIDKSVSSMTQAEKSQLRYYAMLTQVTEAQGDMARTLEQPANMMRVLKAQIEQASRALGNIFIPILTKVLPIAIAVAKGIREIIASIAALFGVEMQEIDWNSSIESAADVTGDISDNMDSAAGSAKELKRYLAGFDELNVLPDQSSGGAGGGVSASTGGDLGIDLPGYDFLGDAVSKNVDKIYKKLKKVIDPIKKILNYLYEYRSIVIAGLGVAAIVTLWKKAKKAWSWFKGLSLVDTFLSGFKTIKDNGGSVFSSINGGITAVRDSLSGIQKAAIVAVAGFAEFTIVKQNVKDLAIGCEDAGSKIAGIGIAATVAGAAMYTALGPYGLALAAVVGLVSAIVGVTEAQNEMMDTIANDAFYSGTGVKIGELSDSYKNLMQDIVDANQSVIDGKSRIDDARESVDKTSRSISGILTAFQDGYEPTSEEINKLKDLFEGLRSDTETIMDEEYDLLFGAVTGSLANALEEAGSSSAEILTVLQTIRGDTDKTMTELTNQLNELNNAYQNGTITMDEYFEGITPIAEKMGIFSDTAVDVSGAFDDILSSIESIDWENQDIEEFFSGIDKATGDAVTSIDEFCDSTIASFEDYKNKTDNAEFQAILDKAISVTNEFRGQKKSEVNRQLTKLFDAIQTDIVKKTQGVKDEAVQEWNDMSWLTKFFGTHGSEASYVHGAVERYKTNIAGPISDGIQNSYSQLGIDGSVWAGNAMDQIINGLFSYEGTTYWSTYYEYVSTMESEIESALNEVGEVGTGVASDTGREIASSYTNGISDGVSENMQGVRDTLTSSVDDALNSQDANSYGYSYGKEFANGISSGIRSSSFPTISGTLLLGGSTVSAKLKAYAGGGFVDAGQLFVAREAGAEMVGSIGRRTAVANNDQIVEAVSSGVYKAVVAAMSNRTPDRGKGQTVTAKVNDKTLFEVIVDYARNETVRTGSNPLLEF